jgi:transposase InsO family protein
VIPEKVEKLILEERQWERVSKDKLAKLIKDDGLGTYSASTIGRMLGDLKKQGKLPDPVKVSMDGRTGNVYERESKPRKVKLRFKNHEGGLVKADSVVRFKDGIKRYILTGMDCESKFAFAYAYTSHSSKAASDFMDKFKWVSPIPITHVQTDNGSEFADHFDIFLEDNGIVHFHTYPRCPKMNAEIERFNRTLSEAFISKNRHLLAHDIDAFNEKLIEWLLWYNSRRPHWSLGLKSPLRYICDQLPGKSQMWWTNAIS